MGRWRRSMEWPVRWPDSGLPSMNSMVNAGYDARDIPSTAQNSSWRRLSACSETTCRKLRSERYWGFVIRGPSAAGNASIMRVVCLHYCPVPRAPPEDAELFTARTHPTGIQAG